MSPRRLYFGEPHWVYRCFDADGSLLYVGMTAFPEQRMMSWRNESRRTCGPAPRWFQQVVRVDWQRYPRQAYASIAERHAIATEHPRHNILHRITEVAS